MKSRSLKLQEKDLLNALLDISAETNLRADLDNIRVTEMSDGGMGSIRFGYPSPGRRLGKTLIEAKYNDVDGIPIFIMLNLDNRGQLFEIDFWKVDFSSLNRYPRFEDLQITKKDG